MKKLFLLIILFLGYSSYSQESLDSLFLTKSTNFNKFKFSIFAGYSDISGLIGLAIDRKNLGLELGWGRKTYALDKRTEKRNVFGFGISYYITLFAKKGLYPYLSLGYSINGSCERKDEEVYWGDKAAFIIGYVFSGDDVPVSFKIGLGYQIPKYYDTLPISMEIKFIIKIFDL